MSQKLGLNKFLDKNKTTRLCVHLMAKAKAHLWFLLLGTGLSLLWRFCGPLLFGGHWLRVSWIIFLLAISLTILVSPEVTGCSPYWHFWHLPVLDWFDKYYLGSAVQFLTLQHCWLTLPTSGILLWNVLGAPGIKPRAAVSVNKNVTPVLQRPLKLQTLYIKQKMSMLTTAEGPLIGKWNFATDVQQ